MKAKHDIIIGFAMTILILSTKSLNSQVIENEEQLEEFLNGVYETEASASCSKQGFAEWEFTTDVNNKEKEEAQLNATLEDAAYQKDKWDKVFRKLNTDNYQKESIIRQVKKLKVLGNAALNQEKLTELTSTINTMTNIYSTAKICPFNQQDCNVEENGLSLEPGIEEIMSTSTNYSELQYAWIKWREASGKKIKSLYPKYIQLSNEAAKANNFANQGEMWITDYESPTFIDDMDRLWEQVKPLYDELHRYVRNKLKTRYGNEIDLSDGLIPAHVLGNMWAQSWGNIYSLVEPFPNASKIDVTAALKEQGYTVLKMFESADTFYKSLGLEPNDICYDVSKGAMIEKPIDREVLCHASAWDFCDGKNYRIKMCTKINYEDFITIHHEMGHIQYFLLYKQQPLTFRNGANPGFHEAVGDTIALSVATPQHLTKIGLLKNYQDDEASAINTLMNMALERVAFLPFGLLIDKWRWDVFAGKVPIEKLNSHWWYYRNFIQKIKSPVPRTADDFDPASKYHVAGDSQYINYFVAHILQFQLYRGLCKVSQQYDPNDVNKPLHKCDFYESIAAGQKLRDGLSLGASKHWKDALEQITGERDLDASAILDYFKPLYDYMKSENGKFNEEELSNFLTNDYEPYSSKNTHEAVVASWNFATDVNNPIKEAEKLKATLKAAEFNKRCWNNYFKNFVESDYENEELKRQVKFLKILGTAALDTDKLTELSNVENTMTTIYSTGKICPFNNKTNCDLNKDGLSLEPDIERILATSTNYDELSYVWEEWRKATGAKIKNHYPKYVALSNEAAVANGFADKGELWRNNYESPTFIEDMDKLWDQVKPLYEELHKYVGKKLSKVYENKLNIEDGLLPAHILGNMWGQSWINLSPLVKPYPSASSIDVTASMLKQNYTVLKMFQTSDQFYQSLGLKPNDMSYDESLGAVIVKPPDREILCHASAWDFSDKKDFRIKMCTEINYEYFITIHHEMGHIQYFIQYKDQPISFRDGANPGFHEAVGDTIALSVSTPKHLTEIGLLTGYQDSVESDINTLMDMALERVAFLPFGFLIDKWRWDVFAGKVTVDKWNSHWWNYRKTIQKVKPPVERSDDHDFDPGAKYHVPGDSQYINYFVAHILQFQLYRGLCKVAGQYDPENGKPLHKCDFYRSKAAGKKLSSIKVPRYSLVSARITALVDHQLYSVENCNVLNFVSAGLSLGSSKHWKIALEAITGEDDLDGTALLEYFDPLLKYLKEQNGTITDTNQLIPIVVGSVIGGILVIAVSYYFYRRCKQKKVNSE